MEHFTSISLTPVEQIAFRQAARKVRLGAGQILFEEEDTPQYVYLIEIGTVKIFRSSPFGEDVTVGIRNNGDVIGIAEVLSGVNRYCYAKTLEDCEIWRLDGNLFVETLQQNPTLAVKVTTALGKRLREAEMIILNLVTLQVDRRLAKLLLDLADKYSKPEAEGLKIDLPLTQQELAAMIGTSRQTISTTLQKLKAKDLVRTSKKSIEIIDLEGLESFANS